MWAEWLAEREDEGDEIAASFLVFRPNYREEERERMKRAGLV